MWFIGFKFGYLDIMKFIKESFECGFNIKNIGFGIKEGYVYYILVKVI